MNSAILCVLERFHLPAFPKGGRELFLAWSGAFRVARDGPFAFLKKE